MAAKLEKFYFDSKNKMSDARPLRAYAQWMKNNPEVKANFRQYVIADCEVVPDTDRFLTLKCRDENGPFLVSEHLWYKSVVIPN